MKTAGVTRVMAWCVTVLAAIVRPAWSAPSDDWRARVEADWARQEQVRGPGAARVARRRARPANVSTQQDAAGAVDGVIDGKWGFHTLHEKQPWWQVDLGSSQALSHALVYNRCDSCGQRNKTLLYLLSDDRHTWRKAWQGDGKMFWGYTDKKPLRVDLKGAKARYLRIQHPGTEYFHLDEVQIFASADPKKNIALGRPCDQSSVSQWSSRSGKPIPAAKAGKLAAPALPDGSLKTLLERGRKLAADQAALGADVASARAVLDAVEREWRTATGDGTKSLPREKQLALYRRARWAVRGMMLANPVLDFDKMLVVIRAPTQYSHMSDQYYGWWSRTGEGAGLYVLEGFRTGRPKLRCLTASLPPGTVLRPDVSFDAKRVLFAYARYYPDSASRRNKTLKAEIPEDAFFHLHELDLATGKIRRLTRGKYDDFDGRYLPDGRIVFLSTRRGTAVQYDSACAARTLAEPALPDSYVRCGGGNSRPVAIYTLHTLSADGQTIQPTSAFENFEWTPSVADDGRILYARWDYIDRHNNAFMSLWATNPDGTNANIVYGNYTRNPQSIFEARSIPGSRHILFTASAHHSITGGSLVLLDADRATEGEDALARLTPEVCFPETESWPATWYANPYPLSETYYLTAWSDQPLKSQGRLNSQAALGVYLYDRFGNLELLWRDEKLCTMYPLPLRPRPRPPVVPEVTRIATEHEGRFLLTDVYQGLTGIERGRVKALRVIGMPMKVQPQMNSPVLGITREDPGKFVVGTVPVEADGSAYFRAPSGVSLLFQALDAKGMALQTMRTATYVQPGQTLSCIGCHEPRSSAPANGQTAAALRAASRLRPAPDGSWPLRFDRLVQPVLSKHCVRCHSPSGKQPAARKLDLSHPDKAYQRLIAFGKPSLHQYVMRLESQALSPVGSSAARDTPLLAHLTAGKGHHNVKLTDEDFERLVTWLDTYAQRLGSFSPQQERDLLEFRHKMAPLLLSRGKGR